MTRIGYQMLNAISVVAEKPGCCKKYVAEIITPCPDPARNWAYGYGPVNRSIKANLIEARRTKKGGRYELYLTEAGRAALKE